MHEAIGEQASMTDYNHGFEITEHRIDTGSPEERVSVPKSLLERICGMVYATRGEQMDQNYINHHEYARLVSLRHNGYGPIETVLKALAPAKEGTK